jgi:hypothetical protein
MSSTSYTMYKINQASIDSNLSTDNTQGTSSAVFIKENSPIVLIIVFLILIYFIKDIITILIVLSIIQCILYNY